MNSHRSINTTSNPPNDKRGTSAGKGRVPRLHPATLLLAFGLVAACASPAPTEQKSGSTSHLNDHGRRAAQVWPPIDQAPTSENHDDVPCGGDPDPCSTNDGAGDMDDLDMDDLEQEGLSDTPHSNHGADEDHWTGDHWTREGDEGSGDCFDCGME
jgi:hypothetical protein